MSRSRMLFQVLNLFLALLLSSFGAESLKHAEADDAPNKLQEAVDRINRFIIYIKVKNHTRVTGPITNKCSSLHLDILRKFLLFISLNILI